jgi:hypothetical protein
MVAEDGSGPGSTLGEVNEALLGAFEAALNWL